MRLSSAIDLEEEGGGACNEQRRGDCGDGHVRGRGGGRSGHLDTLNIAAVEAGNASAVLRGADESDLSMEMVRSGAARNQLTP
jgi:hypothetical protein